MEGPASDDRLLCGMLTKRRRETPAAASPHAQAMAGAETCVRRHLERAAHTPWVQQRPEEYLRLLERALEAVLSPT